MLDVELDPRTVEIAVATLPHHEGLPLPAYQTAGSAGMDLLAALPDIEKKGVVKPGKLKLRSGARALVPTGLTIALPEGFEAQVRPRSGLALRQGITCLNTPGTIDADYRGEIQVLLINLGDEDVTIRRGERIAQLVIAPVTQARWKLVAALSDSVRGAGGFGSTGT